MKVSEIIFSLCYHYRSSYASFPTTHARAEHDEFTFYSRPRDTSVSHTVYVSPRKARVDVLQKAPRLVDSSPRSSVFARFGVGGAQGGEAEHLCAVGYRAFFR